MKKILLLITLLLYGTGLWSQSSPKVKSVFVSQSINVKKARAKNDTINYTIQFGLPFLGRNSNPVRVIAPLDIRFPWNVQYMVDTFTEETFFVSKGYHEDKVEISWDIVSSEDAIQKINIYRRFVDENNADDFENYERIATLAPDIKRHEDKGIEAAFLYEYKVEAVFKTAQPQKKYFSYITGIGIKNPTATITGNISYSGNQPVEDVIVRIEQGNLPLLSGPSLHVLKEASILVKTKKTNITNKLTFQTWIKTIDTNWDSDKPLILLDLNNGFVRKFIDLKIDGDELSVNVNGAIFTLQNYFPTGTKDNRGDDVMELISKFHEGFVHLSVVMEQGEVSELYINGRGITADYQNTVNTILDEKESNLPRFVITTPGSSEIINLNYNGEETVWNTIKIGGGKEALIDEIRIWNTALSASTIKQDYGRYISGKKDNLVSYLRANESVGRFAYDSSKSRLDGHNEAHGLLFRAKEQYDHTKVTWARGIMDRPKNSQLGVFGVTNENGNYSISAIPYRDNTPDLFKITPMFGQHKFSPPPIEMSIGKNNPTTNGLNFTDVSSFSFKGVVLYDTKGVFPSFAEANNLAPKKEDTVEGQGRILERGYNTYEINKVTYEKGAHLLNDAGTPGDTPAQRADDYLDKYATIYVEGANILIDGELVRDERHALVKSDENGYFDIQVPIGNHSIEVVKEGHSFYHNGIFPATGLKNFFEDSNKRVFFIDSTRVTVIGRVVGGPVEGAKVTGFGAVADADATIIKTQVAYDADLQTVIPKEVSSVNNIGTATITLNQASADVEKPESRITFKTNSETGEYRVNLLPISYRLNRNDLDVKGALIGNSGQRESLHMLDANEPLDFSNAAIGKKIPTYEYESMDSSTGALTAEVLLGDPYDFKQSFIYRSVPNVKVVNQSSDASIKVNKGGGVIDNINVLGFGGPKFYTMNNTSPYTITLERIETYTNYDNEIDGTGSSVVSEVSSIDGELIINNLLTSQSTDNITVTDPTNSTREIYSFFANGDINLHTSALPELGSFEVKSSLKYRINGNDYDVVGFDPIGIMMGYVERPGIRAFATNAPEDMPDIILRDPPGAGSFAVIKKNTKISISNNLSVSGDVTGKGGYKLMNGASIVTGVQNPATYKQTRSTVYATVDGVVGLSVGGGDTNELVTTYTFNEEISTYNAPTHVGAKSDLYIGRSLNYFYAPCDELFISFAIPKEIGSDGVSLVDMSSNDYREIVVGPETYYLYKGENKIFGPEPVETTFILSQKFILGQLIPEYQENIAQLQPGGTMTAGVNDVLTEEDYKNKIYKWRRVILNNEISKYLAKNNPQEYRSIVTNAIDAGVNTFETDAILVPDDMTAEMSPTQKAEFEQKHGEQQQKYLEDLLKTQLNAAELKTLIDNNFLRNVTLDSGPGGITSSVETSSIKRVGNSFVSNLTSSFESFIGTTSDAAGRVAVINLSSTLKIEKNHTTEDQRTTAFEYTLLNTDKGNSMSIDIVNSFDGNGPIFITKGGKTSCPFEGPETSNFLSEVEFRSFADAYLALDTGFKTIQEYFPDGGKLGFFSSSQRSQYTYYKDSWKAELQTLKDDFYDKLKVPMPSDSLALLNYGTENADLRSITVDRNNISNVPEDGQAEFNLVLLNESTAGAQGTTWFTVEVDHASNKDGAVFNLGEYGVQSIELKYGEPVNHRITMKKGTSVNEYKDVKILLVQDCDKVLRQEINYVSLSASFIPSCTKVTIMEPENNWVYNNANAYTKEEIPGGETVVKTKPLLIEISEFNPEFNDFLKINLEYRLEGTSSWNRLKSYYRGDSTLSTPEDPYDKAASGDSPEQNIEAIGEERTLFYEFDIAALKLPNGKYELRTKSFCTTTEYTLNTIVGVVDLNGPRVFGTPTPIDGILGPGEDLLVRFNEEVKFDSGVTEIEIKGVTNQLEIDHNVSLRLEGANNTAVIDKLTTVSGDFALEFWLKNDTAASSNSIVIIQQDDNGLEIGIENNEIYFQLTADSKRIHGSYIKEDNAIGEETLFHHYTFTYNARLGKAFIYSDDQTVAEDYIGKDLLVSNSKLTIGSAFFIGNIHDLRLWNKNLTLSDSYEGMYKTLRGNESHFLGYWPFSKGRGTIANDLSRFKHASLANEGMWDIKPKGNSYEFKDGQYLKLEDLNLVNITEEMDATVSFWMKADETSNGTTLFSNGTGSEREALKVNGFRNKWAVQTNADGKLVLTCEGNSHILAEPSITDNAWHHVALLFNRRGNLETYIDGKPSISVNMDKIAGFYGYEMVFGGRMYNNPATGQLEVDNKFTGKLDEFRLWNTLRNEEQIERDRFFEVDTESIGLLLYADMNYIDSGSDVPTTDVEYYRASLLPGLEPANAKIGGGGSLNHSDDSPPIKPLRSVIKFGVLHELNADNDQMVIKPILTNWASVEGQILDITVHRMYDMYSNQQESPVTWTAYVKRHEVSWFVEGHDDVVTLINYKGEDPTTFEITLVNRGGTVQDYTIKNLPSWLKLNGNREEISGVLNPDKTRTIIATIDDDVNIGDYLEYLSLDTGYGYIEKLPIKLKVLEPAPDWSIDTNQFSNTMSIVGRIKVDGVISEDIYDKIAVFYGDEVRGVGSLRYNTDLKEYITYLTVYDTKKANEENPIIGAIKYFNFKIWDASQGKVLEATFKEGNDNPVLSIPFDLRDIKGSKDNPIVFENTENTQQIINLNEGWTWVSFNVEDKNFGNMKELTRNLELDSRDRIISFEPYQYAKFHKSLKDEDGELGAWVWRSLDGNEIGANDQRIFGEKMYQIYSSKEQPLILNGSKIDFSSYKRDIVPGWNWISYPVQTIKTVNEALGGYIASVGDLIKGHTGFSQYGENYSWEGDLDFLAPGKGYMLYSKATEIKELTFPAYFASSKSKNSKAVNLKKIATRFTKYSKNMNAIVSLPEGYTTLSAYDDQGVLKGSSKGQLIDGEMLSFITLYGDNTENLTFHIGNDSKEIKTSKVIDFVGNKVLGTVSDPVILELEGLDTVQIFPNPFSDKLTISVTVSKDETVTLNLYSILNQKVLTKKFNAKKGKNVFELKTNRIPSGIYLLKIDKNENSIAYKVIKK